MTTTLVAPTNFPATGMFGNPTFDWAGFEPFPSHFLGVSSFDTSDSDNVRTYLNWDALFRKWEIPVSFPQVLDDAEWGAAARSLFYEANALLNDFLQAGKLRLEVMFGVWRASAEGNQVLIQTGHPLPVRISFPRLPMTGESTDSTLQPGQSTYCLADFVKPARVLTAGESDYIGGYAIRLGAEVLEPIRQWEASQDNYHALLATDLCDLYRSAVADYLHYRLRRFIWAYCDDDDLSNEELMEGMHQGIRGEIGGPSCPDRTAGPPLLQLLGIEEHTFTGNDTYSPTLTECGFFFAHPKSRQYPLASMPTQTAPLV